MSSFSKNENQTDQLKNLNQRLAELGSRRQKLENEGNQIKKENQTLETENRILLENNNELNVTRGKLNYDRSQLEIDLDFKKNQQQAFRDRVNHDFEKLSARSRWGTGQLDLTRLLPGTNHTCHLYMSF